MHLEGDSTTAPLPAPDDVLTELEASRYLNTNQDRLSEFRRRGTGPAHFLHHGRICYLRRELDRWGPEHPRRRRTG